MSRRREPDVTALSEGVLARDRASLGRAITLVESNLPRHQERAQELLVRLLPHTGGARRVGITGVPGVGKSTFVEALGTSLCDAGSRVAVLAIDPTSTLSHGSILGDKTRMTRLAQREEAFIRPSPTSGSLGGVARKTRETMLLCEAAGYDVVLVETVGVGQSETVVAGMVDFFLVLMLAGAGDELQGIKKGVLELADLIAINKADGDNELPAKRAAREYRSALRYLRARDDGWTPPVELCSALESTGITDICHIVEDRLRECEDSGALASRRAEQRLRWMWQMVEDTVVARLHGAERVRSLAPELEAQVRGDEVTATLAARRLLDAFLGAD